MNPSSQERLELNLNYKSYDTEPESVVSYIEGPLQCRSLIRPLFGEITPMQTSLTVWNSGKSFKCRRSSC